MRTTLVLAAGLVVSLAGTPTQAALTKDAVDSVVNKDTFKAARALSLKRDYEQALSLYDKVIQFYPKLACAYRYRGWCEFRVGKFSQALNDFTEAIALQPSATIYSMRGSTYLQMEQNDKAIEDFTKAISLSPGGGFNYGERALAYTRMQQYQSAIPDYNTALAACADDCRLWAYRGFAYDKAGDKLKAVADYQFARGLNSPYFMPSLDRIDDYTACLMLDEDNGPCYRNRGRAYAELGEYDLAMRDYLKALSINAGDNSARELLALAQANIVQENRYIDQTFSVLAADVQSTKNHGAIFLQRGQYKAAIDAFTTGLANTPMDATLYRGRAQAYDKSGNLAKAQSDLESALRLNPRDIDAWRCRADIDRKTGQSDKTIADDDQIISLDPKDKGVLLDQAQLYEKAGKPIKAIDDYTRLIALAPDARQFYLKRGGIYERLGYADRAKADYASAAKLDPDDQAASKKANNTDQTAKQNSAPPVTLSIAQLSQSIAANPNDTSAMLRRAHQYENSHDETAALNDYAKVIALEPLNVEALTGRATIYDALGQRDKAMADYTVAIKVNPTDASLYAKRARIYEKLDQLDLAKKDLQTAKQLGFDAE